MLFKYEDLEHSVLCESSDDELGLEFIEASEWEQDGKYQHRHIVFKFKDKFYMAYETRSGSPFSDWHYNDQDLDKDGMLDCDEVFKVENITSYWSRYTGSNKLSELRERLDDAESLLSQASSMLNNVHCYDTDLYRDINKFFGGEEEQ